LTKRRKTKAIPNSNPPPPPPKNGTTYGVGEFMQIVVPLSKSKQCRLMLRMMDEPYEYIRKHQASVYHLLSAYNKGVRFAFDKPWNKTRRKNLLTRAQVVAGAKRLTESQGKKHINSKVNDIFVEQERKNGGVSENTENSKTLQRLTSTWHYLLCRVISA